VIGECYYVNRKPKSLDSVLLNNLEDSVYQSTQAIYL
jgi:hypothetical protein